jgi:hypothetical protein
MGTVPRQESVPNSSMQHREPKSEIDDTGQILQGALCTIAAVDGSMVGREKLSVTTVSYDQRSTHQCQLTSAIHTSVSTKISDPRETTRAQKKVDGPVGRCHLYTYLNIWLARIFIDTDTAPSPSLTCLECQVSELVNSEACPRPTTTHRRRGSRPRPAARPQPEIHRVDLI